MRIIYFYWQIQADTSLSSPTNRIFKIIENNSVHHCDQIKALYLLPFGGDVKRRLRVISRYNVLLSGGGENGVLATWLRDVKGYP